MPEEDVAMLPLHERNSETKYTPPLVYRGMPESADLIWQDDFFDRENQALMGDGQNVIAVFDFDYVAMEEFETQTTTLQLGIFFVIGCAYWGMMGAMLMSINSIVDDYLRIFVGGILGVMISLLIGSLCCAPWNIPEQTRWAVQSKHVAITEDGVRFVQDKRKSHFGIPMCDQGKTSRTIAFDQIVDCDVSEPAGNVACCYIPRTLYTVQVASSVPGHSILLTGLKEPYKFRRLVWALKRSKTSGSSINCTYWPPANATIMNSDQDVSSVIVV